MRRQNDGLWLCAFWVRGPRSPGSAAPRDSGCFVVAASEGGGPPGGVVSEFARPVAAVARGVELVTAGVGGVEGVVPVLDVSPPPRAALPPSSSLRLASVRSRRICAVVPSDSLTPNSLRSGAETASSSGRTSSADRSEISAPRGLDTVSAMIPPTASAPPLHHTARCASANRLGEAPSPRNRRFVRSTCARESERGPQIAMLDSDKTVARLPRREPIHRPRRLRELP